MAQTTFSLEYIISIIIVMVVVGMIQKSAPKTSIAIKIIVVGQSVANYSKNSMYGTINNTGFIQMYPPLFAVLIIFLVMLYSGQL